MPRAISIHNAHPRLKMDVRSVRRAIHALDQAAASFGGGPPTGELSLAFLTDEALAQLHGSFLNDPSRTDVITFEGEPTFGTAGEVCVSVDTAARYATEHGGDFARELTLYVVHGWLHLAGYDDLEPTKKRRMRAAEARALTLLHTNAIIPVFRIAPTARKRKEP